MKILLLNLYYPPDTSATAKMAATVVETLSARHEVTVLCGRPSYEPSERRHWRLWQSERAANTKIIRVGSTDYSRAQMKGRVLNYLSYVSLAIPRALFVTCDAVLAMTDPPFEGIVGAIVAVLKGRPYIYNIRDMYPDMAVGGAIVQPGLLSRVWEKLHRWALRRAKLIIVLGEDMRARIARKGVDGSKIVVVRDGADIPVAGAGSTPVDNEVIRTIRGDDKFVLLHAGNLGFYGAWQTLVQAIGPLKPDGVGLVFVGDGAQKAAVQSLAEDAKNIRFLPFFPSSMIPSVLAAPDAHVISVKRGLEGVVVPSKMYGILAAGKPIVAVAAAETDAAALGTRLGFAVSADPDNPQEVERVISTLAADPEKLERMRQAARDAAPGYDRVKELQKFVRSIEEALRA
ncbi:MAG TPA: glycosyltransferase family 4 protein [Candidatus Methylomirabilis sp.]|nr:glycosyltransferase family 4 protein [Candidatus Methylomirabilis sp.]